MDQRGRYSSGPGHVGSFARSSDDSPVSSNWRSAAAKKKTLTGSDRFQSHFMSSNYPGDERRGHDEYLAPHRESDIPLDAFDKELLASEKTNDRGWQALKMPARVSLPPKRDFTPSNASTTRQSQRDELHATSPVRNLYSSSPGGNVSSPTTVALNQRRDNIHNVASNGAAELDHSSPLSRKGAVGLSGTFHARDRNAAPASRIQLGHAPPLVQGIQLVAVNDLPDRLRSLFTFPLFNAVQSKCFDTAFKTDDNLVLSAPTGSGKTVIMELAICRLMQSLRSGEFKIVYQAPTKALCSERCMDWQAKFGSMDLQCAELTGDTDASQMRSVKAANIIITTPEKWDSITRRWKDHIKLMRLVKLFLVDEVHILKESRGATLEAVVSRMKSTESPVRFVALSATVPNSEDVAMWLGKDSHHPHLPAHREVFGEFFRPVQLQKVVYGYPVKSNDFAFDSILESKLPEIIAKHSRGRPILIFCPFRKSCVKTAKSLTQLWTSTMPSDRLWSGPSKAPGILDNELRQFVSAGVAFHHAGLDVSDRRAVEQAFLSHNISIICCTSTLAVGVNLPCYLVIIKGTVAWTDNGLQEYADLEMMQMLGRAGRPQFEQSACAVILTRNERVDYYNRLVSGQEPLESCLHLNLVDHLNAEIGLGTVSDLPSAKRWLASTFLFVRLSRNPSHYRLKEDVTSRNDDELLERICSKDISLLQEADLVTKEGKLSCSEFGDAMARYYVKFETMKIFLSLAPKAKISEIISAIAQADEFYDIRLKSGEKSLYKHVNKDVGIKFPIKVDIALSAHKVSLLLQAELGGLDFPVGEQFAKHKSQFQQDKAMVFQHVNRLIRCVIDCQLTLGDAVSARHALSLARSFAARVWDNSPLQLKQLDQIGNVAVRKLANAGINSIELLENTEAHRIESVIGRGPPFGMKLLSKLEQFPKLRVLVKMIGKEMKLQKHVKVKLKAEIGFLNQNVPVFFRKKPIYVCFLAETSDGQIVDFRRIVASKLSNGQEIHLTAELTKPSQYISCHVMCDEIAGTCRSAEVRPNLPVSFFPTSTEQTQTEKKDEKGSKSLNAGQPQIAGKKRKASEEFEDGGLDDGDLLAAESVDIMDIDAFDEELASLSATARLSSNKTTSGTKKKTREDDGNDPVRLENGKWACNHKCKDKDKCKHFCCKEGLDKPPKPSKPPKKSGTNDAEDPNSIASLLDAVNDNNKLSSQAPATSAKSQPMSKKSKVDHGSGGQGSSLLGSKEAKSLSKLHEATTPHVQTQTLKLAQGSSKFPETGAQRSSATHGASSGTIVDDEFPDEDVFDSNWGNDIGPEDLEDLGFRGDSVKRAQGTNSGTESHKRVVNDDPWPDFGDDDFNFDDNDASMPEATQVGPDSSLSLIGESNSKQSNKNHSDSNVSVSSGTVRESSSPRANQSKADNAFDDDDGIYDFDTGFDPVQPALDAVDPPENVPYPSSIGESPISPAKNLFFTSPERGPRPATTASAGDAPSSQLRHDDETSTSFSTPAVNARVRSPLPNVSDVTPREFRFRTRKSKHFKDPCGKDGGHVSNNDEGAAVEASEAEEKTKEEEEEQRKKLLMDGIDPAFYDEFKDIVEFI